MAATKYEVLYRYYNVDMKMPITNIVNETWVSCFDTAPVKSEKVYSTETFKFHTDSSDNKEEKKIQELLVYGNNANNPKFNMFFMYKAREFKYSNTSNMSYPYVLMDRMERVPLSPWFVHSTHASLSSAITKTRALANLIGHENIKIGKIVPLDQYIEIV